MGCTGDATEKMHTIDEDLKMAHSLCWSKHGLDLQTLRLPASSHFYFPSAPLLLCSKWWRAAHTKPGGGQRVRKREVARWKYRLRIVSYGMGPWNMGALGDMVFGFVPWLTVVREGRGGADCSLSHFSPLFLLHITPLDLCFQVHSMIYRPII